ncbi:MAG: PspC domain-containing protein [Nocardioides sp.]
MNETMNPAPTPQRPEDQTQEQAQPVSQRYPQQHSQSAPPPAYGDAQRAKRLVRRRDDRMIAGVCSGVADYLDLDVTLVRLLTVLATVLGFGSLIVAYIVMWILVPEA